MTETLGQRLQRLRKQASLTQEDVANQLNITAQAVSKWENDISAPDISALVPLSHILGVSLNELLGEEPATKVLPQDQRKNIASMFLRVKCHSSDNDDVNVNLPLALVKVILDSGGNIPISAGKVSLADIDFNKIYQLIESGLVGKIVDVNSGDGDKIEIWVE